MKVPEELTAIVAATTPLTAILGWLVGRRPRNAGADHTVIGTMREVTAELRLERSEFIARLKLNEARQEWFVHRLEQLEAVCRAASISIPPPMSEYPQYE